MPQSVLPVNASRRFSVVSLAFSADDGWMTVLHDIHGRFTLVFLPGLRDAVYRNCFLEDAVSTVFLIPKDIQNHLLTEHELFAWDLNVLASEGL